MKYRILLIGWFAPSRGGGELARYFESQGHEVFKVASEERTKILTEHHCLLMERIEWEYGREFTQKVRERKERIKVKPLIDEFGPFDFLFIHQGNVFFDITDIGIPYYLYQHEMLYPNIPLGKGPDGLFFAYVGGYEQLYFVHTPEIYNMKFQRFVTYATTPSIFYPDYRKRDIKLGFKGSIDFPNGAMNDPLMSIIYVNRKKMMLYARDHLHANIETKSEGFNPFEDLAEFMRRCDICLNVPGVLGFSNERQFHTIASGAILLQWRYPQLEQMGFIDKYNCLLFSSEKEMKAKYKWINRFWRKKLKEQIRQRGIALSKKHTYAQRGRVILEEIEKVQSDIWQSKERDRIVDIIYNHVHHENPSIDKDFWIFLVSISLSHTLIDLSDVIMRYCEVREFPYDKDTTVVQLRSTLLQFLEEFKDCFKRFSKYEILCIKDVKP